MSGSMTKPRRSRLARSITLLLAALPLATPAQEAPVCGWLSNARLDELLPAGAPWRTESGGQSGSCTFMGTDAESFVLLSVTQMLQGSASEAAKRARDIRTTMGATYSIQPVPALGKEGLMYREESDPSRTSIHYIGHDKKLVVMGYLTGPRTIAEQTQGMTRIMQVALAMAEDRKTMKAARICPYVDDRLAKKLLPGGNYEMQRYGDDMCIAHNGKGAVLSVNRMAGMDMEYTAVHRSDDCNWAPAPQLADAFLATACKEGNPRAELHVGLGPDTLNYSLTPGRAPTAAEATLLQELAGKASAVE